jgi:antitoxin component of MazEF toxin-antitoxin module
MSTTTIKLQKIGNSIRATIPKEIVEGLSLHQGDDMVLGIVDRSILLKKKGKNANRGKENLSRFYGILKEKTGPVTKWPSPEEIKSIWE